MLRPITRLLCLSSLACLAGLLPARDAQAQGYVYVPTSFYVSPAVYAYDGYFVPPGASLYTVAPAPPPPAVGYYQPLPVAPVVVAPAYGRVRETWGGGPYASHYRYHVGVPGGPAYTYRARNVGNRVIVHERFR